MLHVIRLASWLVLLRGTGHAEASERDCNHRP
jgi:hypothetical protein